MDKIKIKEKLVNVCRKELDKQLDELIKAMNDAQFEANQHIGAMESRYDSFKEEAQARVNGFARQIDTKRRILPAITKINIKNLYNSVVHGSVVQTDQENYFICAYIVDNPINVDDKDYLPISMNSPLGIAIEGKKSGDSVEIGGDVVNIYDVF
jgi:transcription elongation GreA/GreB family factor|tara:strand:- start:1440 stop:1901 length:462 start_codon:yes stop_codon:yes gene_type:complete